MTEEEAVDPELGRVLFKCLPRPLRSYAALRTQGALPAGKWLKRLSPVSAITSPVAESLILAGLPTIFLIFLLQVVLGLKPPNEPFWVRPACWMVLTISVPVTGWWCWLAPRKDYVIVCERGFRWQVSLCRWKWFRSRGVLTYASVPSFSYRSDCFETEPVEWSKTAAEKLNRIWLEVNLSQYDIALHLKNNTDVVIEDFFARFNQNDLRRFLDHLTIMAEPQRITV